MYHKYILSHYKYYSCINIFNFKNKLSLYYVVIAIYIILILCWRKFNSIHILSFYQFYDHSSSNKESKR